MPGNQAQSDREAHNFTHNTKSYSEIKRMAAEAEALFERHSINVNRTSSLYRLFSNAKDMSDAWDLDGAKGVEDGYVFKMCHAFRILETLIRIKDEPNIFEHLKKLVSDDLDFFKRGHSKAKDFLWELELLAAFKSTCLSPWIAEPDIRVKVGNRLVGVACKKIYSESGLNKVLSDGVRQIAKSRMPGIIAFNIDELYPEDRILRANSPDHINEKLNNQNIAFIRRHEYTFRKYLESSRIFACLISSSLVGDAELAPQRLSNHSQITMWAIPSLSAERRQIADGLHDAIAGIQR